MVENDINELTIEEIVEFCKEKFGLEKMLDQIDDDELLDTIDNGEILFYLDGTYALSNHDDDVREEGYNEGFSDCYNDLYCDKKDMINMIAEYSPDDLHKFICDVMNVGYADQSIIENSFKSIIERLNKNSFNIRYEH